MTSTPQTPLGSIETLGKVLQAISETIDARATSLDEETSYTAKLLAKGPQRTAKKFGEEAVELCIALAAQDDQEVTAEAADVLFHLLVALRSRGISLEDVASVLADRQGISGLAEKAARSGDGI